MRVLRPAVPPLEVYASGRQAYQPARAVLSNFTVDTRNDQRLSKQECISRPLPQFLSCFVWLRYAVDSS